jgi:hypothetical protein
VEPDFRALVVQLVLDGKAEAAVELLANHYRIRPPKIRVGLPKRHRKNTLGCYAAKGETIFVLDSDTLKAPSVVLHEFYHHLRTSPVAKRHKGTEQRANAFAREFTDAYESARAGF